MTHVKNLTIGKTYYYKAEKGETHLSVKAKIKDTEKGYLYLIDAPFLFLPDFCTKEEILTALNKNN